LRDQVVARYQKLDIPTYWAGIHAKLVASFDDKGNVTHVTIEYPMDAVKQHMGYAAMYTGALKEPAKSVTALMNSRSESR
jgi:hypothetical protein